MIIRVLDFETTGFPPDAAVCEVGYTDVVIDDAGEVAVGFPVAFFVDPERGIPPEASAIHHITNADVKGAIKFSPALHCFQGAHIFAAHQAAFERAFIDPPDVPWICTWKVSLRLAPQAPSWKNQVLRYWLGLDVDRELSSPAHRAGPDTYVTAHLLARMLRKLTPADMVAISAEPAILVRVEFGKHKGMYWSEVPSGYMRWCLDEPEMDPDVKSTCTHYLNLRKKESPV